MIEEEEDDLEEDDEDFEDPFGLAMPEADNDYEEE